MFIIYDYQEECYEALTQNLVKRASSRTRKINTAIVLWNTGLTGTQTEQRDN